MLERGAASQRWNKSSCNADALRSSELPPKAAFRTAAVARDVALGGRSKDRKASASQLSWGSCVGSRRFAHRQRDTAATTACRTTVMTASLPSPGDARATRREPALEQEQLQRRRLAIFRASPQGSVS